MLPTSPPEMAATRLQSRRAFIALFATPASLSACRGTNTASSAQTTPEPESRVSAESNDVVIFAASSLTLVLDKMWQVFRTQPGNEGLAVTANYGSSSQLRTQLQEGAKADIFASADVVQMEQVAKAGLVDGNATVFARNRLVVIIPKGNPGKVTNLADLAKPDIKFVTTPPDVPIGAYARASLKKLASDPANGNGYDAKVLANIVSEEANVRQVVVKVQLGEADAGICYATDVTAVPAGEVTTIDIPDSANVVAEYPIAILKSAKAPAAARRLISFINSPSGQSILVAAKFKPA